MTTWAIGDIHGMYEPLTRLLEALPRRPGDTTVFLGDYIDRGPDSRGVLKILLNEHQTAPDHTILLWGNHEDMAASHFNHPNALHTYKYDPYDWFRNGGFETFASWGIKERDCFLASCPEELDQLFRILRPYHKVSSKSVGIDELSSCIDELIFVHAGISPYESPEESLTETLIWSREYNAIACQQPLGRLVVHGHTPFETVNIGVGRIDIDTHCYVGGPLTALEISQDGLQTTLRVWQAFSEGNVASWELAYSWFCLPTKG